MGYYKNDSDQALRVDDGSGRLRRVPAGRVVQADGDFEKNLSGLSQVSSASEDDHLSQSKRSSGNTRDRDRMNAVSDATAYANLIVHAPLNEVIGDDDAPLGPPTGTITTKQAVKDNANSSLEHDRFGQNEWTEKSAEGRDLSPVQQAQADASAVVAKVAQQGIDGDFDVNTDDLKGLSGPANRGGRGDKESSKVAAIKERQKPGPKPKQQPPAENV
jgi:hypothetical protein